MVKFALSKLCNIFIIKKLKWKNNPENIVTSRSFLHRFWIVFTSFLDRFYIVFGSFLHRFCIFLLSVSKCDIIKERQMFTIKTLKIFATFTLYKNTLEEDICKNDRKTNRLKAHNFFYIHLMATPLSRS